MNYSPDLHTPRALAEQMDTIYQYQPDTLMLGSLGRMMVHQRLGGSPYVEFTPETIAVRPDGTVRDIDLSRVNADQGVPLEVQTTQPFSVQDFSTVRGGVERRGGAWFLVSKARGFEAEVDPRVMEPVAQTVLGVKALTLSPQTHVALLGVKGVPRPKDARNIALLEQAMDGNSFKSLPAELFDPFTALKESWERDLITKCQIFYRKVIPAGLHRRLTPLHKKTMGLLNH